MKEKWCLWRCIEEKETGGSGSDAMPLQSGVGVVVDLMDLPSAEAP